MTMKILCTADLHGNMTQYKKLFSQAKKLNVDAIFISGDLTPKDAERRTPQKQADFLNTELIPEIKKFKQECNIEIFLILGNDDFKANEDILKTYDGKLWNYVNEKVIKFNNYSIFGYTNVPVTPFQFKDWEKVDSENVLEETYRKPFILEGVKSTKTNLSSKIINLQNRKDSIENDILKGIKNKENLILLIHAPPFNTNLDLDKNKQHLGSIGVRKAIEKIQPILSIHGHIHETVYMSGNYVDKLGKTICVNPGNMFNEEKLAILEIDLPNLKIKRNFI